MYSRNYNKNSNQKTWANYLEIYNDYENIELDTNSEIFLNYSFTTNNYIKIKDKRIVVNEIKPCFIQGNGCEDLGKIIKAMGYKNYNIHKDKRTAKVIENNLKALFYIYPIAALYIIVLIFSIILVSLFIYKIYKNYNDKYYYIYI